MKTENIAPIFKSNLDTKSEQYLENKKMMLEKLVFLDELLDLAELGGGDRHHERLAKRGKMPVRQRIMNVLDPDSPSAFAYIFYPILLNHWLTEQ